MRIAVLSFVLLPLLACATGGTSRIDDERLVRLPQEARESILDKRRDVNIAEGNLTAMRVAQGEAGKFKQIVGSELEAARARLEADERSASLAREAHDAATATAAEKQMGVGQARLAAAEAKLLYANRLKMLRDAQVTEAHAELELAKARLEMTKYDELRANNFDEGLRGKEFVKAEHQALMRLMDKRERTAELKADVDARQRSWQVLREQYDSEAAKTGEVPLDAPAPPEPVTRPG